MSDVAEQLTSDTDLRAEVIAAAVAYVTRNTEPFSIENSLAWERLERAVKAVEEWKKI